MPTPRADSYSAAAGGSIYAGMVAPSTTPAWLAGKPLNQWFQIANTAGAAGARLDQYSGLARMGNKWVSAASGGHITLDNRVTAIDLSADVPAWSILKANSTVGAGDIPYYSDGKPASRHVYHTVFAITNNRVILPGLRYTYGGVSVFDTVDAFDLNSNQWVGVVADSPGASGSGLANVSPSGYYPVAQDANGDLWCVLHTNGNVAKYTVATNAWSQPAMSNKVSPNVRYPWALDTLRNQLFGLAWGDGEGVGNDVRAVLLTGTTQIAISFSAGSSAALAQFAADRPEYGGMDYDPINDRFIFGAAKSGVPGRFYVVTPNNTTTWDMSMVTFGGATPPAVNGGGGLVKRLTYFPSLKGFAHMPDPLNANIYFLRLAT